MAVGPNFHQPNFNPTELLPCVDGENIVLKRMQEELSKLKVQVQELQQLNQAISVYGSHVGVGTPYPDAKMHVAGDMVLGNDVNGQKFILHPRTNGAGDFLQLAADGSNGAWDWTKGITFRREGKVGINNANPQATLDVNGDIRVKGSKFIHIQQFSGNRINTGYATTDWVATIAGFRTFDGDSQDDHSGKIMQIYTYPENGTWWYCADCHSPNHQLPYTVWVMLIRRELVAVIHT